MIIDSHAHIGTILNFDMQIQTLLSALDKYKIGFCLVSNAESAEVDHQQNKIPDTDQVNQLESAKRMIEIAKQYPEKIGALIWVKPAGEGVGEELEDLISQNLKYIYGLKFHPYHSKISFNDLKVQQYFKLATKYHLPIVTHTANDEESSPKLVFEMAKEYPNLNFVMVHMGLGTDHEEAIEYIATLPNLYGDSTWVTPEKVIKALEVCGPTKILFGTDSPINGVDTYNDDQFYNYYFKEMAQDVSKETYDLFMYENAKRIFKINK